MSSGDIQEVFLHYKFCHHKNCEMANQCLRDRKNASYNTLCCIMQYPDCNSKNGYPLLLQSVPESNELEDDYFGVVFDKEDVSTSETSYRSVEDIIMGYLTENNIPNKSIYLEPFVSTPQCVFSENVKNHFDNVFGTDVDKQVIDKIIKGNKGDNNHFRVCDYQTWNKVLLDDKYKNTSVVLCYLGSKLYKNFDKNQFTEVVGEWSKNNLVFCISKDILLDSTFTEKISDDLFLYLVSTKEEGKE